MSTLRILDKIKKADPDYNNMRVWSGFFFDQEFVLPKYVNTPITHSERTQWFLDYKVFYDYNINLEAIGELVQKLYPENRFLLTPQVAYSEQTTGWDLGPHVHDNEVAVHMTIFLNKEENEGLYVHNTQENFLNDAVHVKNIFDNCCIFPFTGKEWHGINGDNINGTRKLLYIDWMKI